MCIRVGCSRPGVSESAHGASRHWADSSTSSIRRLCRSNPSWYRLGVRSAPLRRCQRAQRGKPAWGPWHMLALPHTSPSEHVVLENKNAHSVSVVGMQLQSLGRRPWPLQSFEVLYTAASTKDRKNWRLQKIIGVVAVGRVLRNRLLDTVLYVAAVTGCGRHLHRARAIHQCAVLLYPEPAIKYHQGPATGSSHTLCRACHVVH